MREQPGVKELQEIKQELRRRIERIKEDVDFQKTLLREANSTLTGRAKEEAIKELHSWGYSIRLDILETKQDIRKKLPIEKWNKPEQLLDGLLARVESPERPSRNIISYFKDKKGE